MLVPMTKADRMRLAHLLNADAVREAGVDLKEGVLKDITIQGGIRDKPFAEMILFLKNKKLGRIEEHYQFVHKSLIFHPNFKPGQEAETYVSTIINALREKAVEVDKVVNAEKYQQARERSRSRKEQETITFQITQTKERLDLLKDIKNVPSGNKILEWGPKQYRMFFDDEKKNDDYSVQIFSIFNDKSKRYNMQITGPKSGMEGIKAESVKALNEIDALVEKWAVPERFAAEILALPEFTLDVNSGPLEKNSLLNDVEPTSYRISENITVKTNKSGFSVFFGPMRVAEAQISSGSLAPSYISRQINFMKRGVSEEQIFKRAVLPFIESVGLTEADFVKISDEELKDAMMSVDYGYGF